MTGEDMIAAMDTVGGDAAIIVSTWAMYGSDASYAHSVYTAHPDRFRLVVPVDPNDPGVGETIDDWPKTAGSVGTRILMYDNVSHAPVDPGINWMLRAAGRNSLPVNLACRGRLEQVAQRPLAIPAPASSSTILASPSQNNCRPPKNPGLTYPSCSNSRSTTMSPSRSAVPAHCRASRFHTTISGSRCVESSTPSASTDVCGGAL